MVLSLNCPSVCQKNPFHQNIKVPLIFVHVASIKGKFFFLETHKLGFFHHPHHQIKNKNKKWIYFSSNQIQHHNFMIQSNPTHFQDSTLPLPFISSNPVLCCVTFSFYFNWCIIVFFLLRIGAELLLFGL